MATFPAIIMFLSHKEVPNRFVPAINSFWYLISNNILGYCERPDREELAILISCSRLLSLMCGIYLSNIILDFYSELRAFGAPFTLSLVIRHFEVARETGSRWLWECIVGLFWGSPFQHGGKFVPQNSPTMLFTTISTGLQRNLKVANLIARMLNFYLMKHSQSLTLEQ